MALSSDRPGAFDLVVQRARAIAQPQHHCPAALAPDDIAIGFPLLFQQVGDHRGEARGTFAKQPFGCADEIVLLIGVGAKGRRISRNRIVDRRADVDRGARNPGGGGCGGRIRGGTWRGRSLGRSRSGRLGHQVSVDRPCHLRKARSLPRQ